MTMAIDEILSALANKRLNCGKVMFSDKFVWASKIISQRLDNFDFGRRPNIYFTGLRISFKYLGRRKTIVLCGDETITNNEMIFIRVPRRKVEIKSQGNRVADAQIIITSSESKLLIIISTNLSNLYAGGKTSGETRKSTPHNFVEITSDCDLLIYLGTDDKDELLSRILPTKYEIKILWVKSKI